MPWNGLIPSGKGERNEKDALYPSNRNSGGHEHKEGRVAKEERGVCSSCLSLVIFVPSRFCGGQLVCRIFFTCHGPGDGDTQVPKLIAQTAAGDAQNLGCLNLVAAGMLQHPGQEGFFHPAQTVLIKILRGEAKLFVNVKLRF